MKDDARKKYRLLRPYIRSNLPLYALGVLLICLANVLQTWIPRVLGRLTDGLESGGMTHRSLMDYSLLLLGLGIGYGILGGSGQHTIMRLGRKFEAVTRQKLFEHFTGLSESFYSKSSVGGLLSYFMNDVTAVREALSRGINQSVNSVMVIVSAVAMMLLSSIPAYLIACCIVPILLIPVLVYRFKPVIHRRSLDVQESLSKMTASAEEQIGGIRVTKKFAAETTMLGRFAASVDRIRDNQVRLVRVSSLFQAMIPFLGSLSLVITLGFGGYLTIRHRISLGDFVALTLYMRMMVNPLQQIGNVINTMQRSQASFERLGRLLEEEAAEREEREALASAACDLRRDAIRIHGLSFSYPGTNREALRDIDLTIRPGRTLGILGKTGSGKTTLAKLLLRMYEPPEGTMFAGDRDIRTIDLQNLRGQIAYVPQEGFLFSTTIRDNIAFYRRDSELGPVRKAAEQAQIEQNILEFPEQYETRLGERGLTLSGGQRQRTSLARGLIKRAPLLILDDSVSAVDSVTEKKIIRVVREERKQQTTVIIAHRISALKHADEIVVLDEGRIAQRGTHAELLADRDGLYAKLYAIQGGYDRHAGNGSA